MNKAPLSDEHVEIARDLCAVLNDAELGDELATARLLYVRVRVPHAYATLVGETSTGKSSLANGLFVEPLLPTYADPTTASVTHLALHDTDEPSYLAVFRDGTQQAIDRDVFVAQNASPHRDLLRLQVRCAPGDPSHVGMQVFDTPGYNAVIARHEEVLRQFLPHSDVVVFVSGYRTGFGQVDQDLLEVVQTSIEDDPDIPVILVVNRAPPGTDASVKRVIEILDNARDCLKREPTLQIVESTTITSDASPPPDPPPTPDSRPVWDAVQAVATDPERQRVVASKLEQMMRQLVSEADDALERQQLLAGADREELAQMEEQVAIVRDGRDRSLKAVQASMTRLEEQMAPTLRRAADQMLERLEKEVDDSNKWLDKEGCATWLTQHALPFEARRAAKSTEVLIEAELNRLNEELEEIANTTVQRIERSVTVKSRAAARFAVNLGRTIAQRVGGAAIHSSLRALGGIGGAAAGAGNLVKMVVSRSGKLFGKTFSREVYNQIGRTFTKRALQRMAAGLQVLIEAIDYIVDAKTWQKKTKTELAKSVASWRDDVLKDLRENMLPEIQAANDKLVRSIYDDLIAESEQSEQSKRGVVEEDEARVSGLRVRLADLHSRLDNLAPTPKEAP